jgi:hypothetical protein
MEIITGYTGKPHVTSEQDRDVNIGVVGEGSYVLRTGMRLAAEVSSNNEIKIRDGVLMHQGCTASIKKNTYDSLTITNGSQGMKRVDLIVARYEKNQDNGIESLDLKVIQGTPAESNPAAPQYTEGDIQAGDYVADMPMYQVIIEGLNITEVKKMFKVIGSNKDLADKLTELNKNIACSPSVKRQETLVSFQRNQRYKIEHTGQIQFACAFSSTQGYCRIYVYNSSGEIVYREQLNPAPVPSNEVATGQLAVFEGWEFLAESYNALVAGAPKYTLTY